MRFGPLHTIGMAEARERALAGRKLRLAGIDPILAKEAEKPRKTAEAAAEATALITFKRARKATSATTRPRGGAGNTRGSGPKHLRPMPIR